MVGMWDTLQDILPAFANAAEAANQNFNDTKEVQFATFDARAAFWPRSPPANGGLVEIYYLLYYSVLERGIWTPQASHTSLSHPLLRMPCSRVFSCDVSQKLL